MWRRFDVRPIPSAISSSEHFSRQSGCLSRVGNSAGDGSSRRKARKPKLDRSRVPLQIRLLGLAMAVALDQPLVAEPAGSGRSAIRSPSARPISVDPRAGWPAGTRFLPDGPPMTAFAETARHDAVESARAGGFVAVRLRHVVYAHSPFESRRSERERAADAVQPRAGPDRPDTPSDREAPRRARSPVTGSPASAAAIDRGAEAAVTVSDA